MRRLGWRAQSRLTMSLTDWFLTAGRTGQPGHRDRPSSRATAPRGPRATTGTVLVDGAEYFARLHEVLLRVRRRATGCRSPTGRAIPTSCSTDPGTEVGEVLAELAARGVNVRGLLWRSHPEAMNFGEAKNLAFSRAINEAGGQVLLDHRVRRGGSHHQKLFVVQHDDPARDVAFVGGIDLCHGRARRPRPPRRSAGRRARRRALRRPTAVARPAARAPRARRSTTWRGRSPSAGAIPNPLDTRNPLRSVLHRVANHPGRAGRARRRRGRRRPTVRSRCRCCARTRRAGGAVPVRARGRAQHRPRLPQGVRPRPPARVPRGPVPLVARRDRGAARRRCAATPSCRSWS